MRLRSLLFPALIALLAYGLAPRAAQAEYELDQTQTDAPAVEEKGPPLPFHTIEGAGGGAITPMAYLVNPAPNGRFLGEPSVAFSYVNLGRKNLDALTVTENFFGRIDVGYAADRLGLGTLPADIRTATQADIGTTDVWLHHVNVRFLAVKENENLPAITFGIDCKFNENIQSIDDRLGGALTGIGYRHANGQDYTLTLTKTIPEALGKPVVVTGGVRASQAANLGFLGFGDTYHATFEGSVAVLPAEWLLFAYEFRQKTDPLRSDPGPDQRRGQLARLRRGAHPEQAFNLGGRLRHLRHAGQCGSQQRLVAAIQVRVLSVTRWPWRLRFAFICRQTRQLRQPVWHGPHLVSPCQAGRSS